MPTALSTTKRKFHKLLDSISNASSPNLTTHPTTSTNASTTTLATSQQQDLSLASKRPRLDKGRPVSAYVPRNAGTASLSSASPSRPKSIAATQTKPTLSLSGEHKQPPNFAPWDRDRFLVRLKTYRFVDKWRAKPDERIGEVQWARRGWSCVGRERVGCVGGCSEEIVIVLEEEEEEDLGEKGRSGEEGEKKEVDAEADGGEAADEEEKEKEKEERDDWREKAQQQLIERYAEMISTGHAEGCLWRRRGCDDTIQRLPLVHQNIALDGLYTRYHSLLAMASELPTQVSAPESLDTTKLTHQATSLLLQRTPPPPTPSPSSNPSPATTAAAPPPNPEHKINESALLLALTGWQAEGENHIPGLATCNACFRRLGLWLFKPSSSSSSSDSESSMDRLDVIAEHRDYCPWVNPLSQNGNGAGLERRGSLDGLSGWEMLLRAVNARANKWAGRGEGRSEKTNAVIGGGGGVSLEGDDGDDDGGDVASFVGTVAGEDEKSRDEKDRERWARLKRLKQVFHVKKRPGTSGSAATAITTTSTGRSGSVAS